MKIDRCLCIIGMHRSGTSVTANWLQQCGLNIGVRLLRPDFSNQKGHFEDWDFLELHKSLLEEQGLPASGLLDVKEIRLTRPQVERISQLVSLKMNQQMDWGWKEPRTCLFLSDYIKLLPEIKVFYIHRDANEIVRSLVHRDMKRKRLQIQSLGVFKRQIERIKFLLHAEGEATTLALHYLAVVKCYYRHLLKAFRNIRSENLLVADLSILRTEGQKVVNHFNIKWGFSLDFVPFSTVYDDNLLREGHENIRCPVDAELKELSDQILSYKAWA